MIIPMFRYRDLSEETTKGSSIVRRTLEELSKLRLLNYLSRLEKELYYLSSWSKMLRNCRVGTTANAVMNQLLNDSQPLGTCSASFHVCNGLLIQFLEMLSKRSVASVFSNCDYP